MTPATATAEGFAGWFKPQGGRWQIVCDGPDHGTAYTRLIDYVAAARRSGDSMVLPTGDSPNRKPGRTAR